MSLIVHVAICSDNVGDCCGRVRDECDFGAEKVESMDSIHMRTKPEGMRGGVKG